MKYFPMVLLSIAAFVAASPIPKPGTDTTDAELAPMLFVGHENVERRSATSSAVQQDGVLAPVLFRAKASTKREAEPGVDADLAPMLFRNHGIKQ